MSELKMIPEQREGSNWRCSSCTTRACLAQAVLSRSELALPREVGPWPPKVPAFRSSGSNTLPCLTHGLKGALASHAGRRQPGWACACAALPCKYNPAASLLAFLFSRSSPQSVTPNLEARTPVSIGPIGPVSEATQHERATRRSCRPWAGGDGIQQLPAAFGSIGAPCRGCRRRCPPAASHTCTVEQPAALGALAAWRRCNSDACGCAAGSHRGREGALGWRAALGHRRYRFPRRMWASRSTPADQPALLPCHACLRSCNQAGALFSAPHALQLTHTRCFPCAHRTAAVAQSPGLGSQADPADPPGRPLARPGGHAAAPARLLEVQVRPRACALAAFSAKACLELSLPALPPMSPRRGAAVSNSTPSKPLASRNWALPALMVITVCLPLFRRADTGLALLLHRAPLPGWRSAAMDALRTVAGERQRSLLPRPAGTLWKAQVRMPVSPPAAGGVALWRGSDPGPPPSAAVHCRHARAGRGAADQLPHVPAPALAPAARGPLAPDLHPILLQHPAAVCAAGAPAPGGPGSRLGAGQPAAGCLPADCGAPGCQV